VAEGRDLVTNRAGRGRSGNGGGAATGDERRHGGRREPEHGEGELENDGGEG
jgi:hypothetical protein